jgi:XisH protein
VAQRDRYHHLVKAALVKDGWTITHDPYTLPSGRRNLFVDLGAERIIAAERGGETIAVEVKSFLRDSEVADLEDALGQFVLYRAALRRHDPARRLVLAVPLDAFDGVWTDEVGQAVVEDEKVFLLVYDPAEEVIKRWLP